MLRVTKNTLLSGFVAKNWKIDGSVTFTGCQDRTRDFFLRIANFLIRHVYGVPAVQTGLLVQGVDGVNQVQCLRVEIAGYESEN